MIKKLLTVCKFSNTCRSIAALVVQELLVGVNLHRVWAVVFIGAGCNHKNLTLCTMSIVSLRKMKG